MCGEEGNIIDSVGFIGGGNQAQYIEGSRLESGNIAARRINTRMCGRRTMATNGLPQDTNNNADDFVLVSVTGTAARRHHCAAGPGRSRPEGSQQPDQLQQLAGDR